METETRSFISRLRLQEDLGQLGLKPGATVVVHSSLRSIGWVVGGPLTVVQSLVDVLGDEGTLVMPAATPHCTDPVSWTAPKIPPEKIEEVREAMPVFDARITPTSLGAIPETFRNWPGTVRSRHPVESVCARGPNASFITRDHPLEFSEGVDGPFGRLHDVDAQILLLGVGFNRCTALHYAESLVPNRRTTAVRFPEIENGRRVWREVPNVADDNDRHFPAVGERYLAVGRALRGSVGAASSLLFPMRELVSIAAAYFEETLSTPGSG